nr:unnamed protein product [Callosobruchus analis]
MNLETTIAFAGGFCLFKDLSRSKLKKRRRKWSKKWLIERNKFSHMSLNKRSFCKRAPRLQKLFTNERIQFLRTTAACLQQNRRTRYCYERIGQY